MVDLKPVRYVATLTRPGIVLIYYDSSDMGPWEELIFQWVGSREHFAGLPSDK